MAASASHGIGLAAAGIGHPRVRQFLNIKHNRGGPGRLRRNDAFALEGTWAVGRALEARVPVNVEVAFVCPPLLRGDESRRLLGVARERGAVALEVSERVLARMVDRDGPDGLAAIAHLPSRRLADLDVGIDGDRAAAGESHRIVVADNIELAGNLGTIIRCADGAGAAAVLLTDRRIRVNHPLVLKASMGTVFSMPVVPVERSDAAAWLRGHGFRVIAADPAAPVSYRSADYGGRVAVVLGSERYGLAPFWRDTADTLVSIPMLGVADSLNVGHAAALLLYEALHAG